MKINLILKKTVDLEALDHGLSLFVWRVYARIRFRTIDGWTEERLAIVDTGSPYSTIPAPLWEVLEKKAHFKTKISGIVPHSKVFLKAILADVDGALVDSRNVTEPLAFPAFLADSREVPIILGFARLLEKFKLVVDTPQNRAWVEL
ncbi:MAG: hypothetical protein HY747_10480 [Elusimicrobia bacterium]|nr:hypothetical protein [Elusimicrobiota bacterium]